MDTNQPCRVLCVDDNEDTCLMLKVLLGTHGNEIETAASVAEAKRLARSRRYDLYILDNRYPDGTGVDLCQTIRALDPQATIIFYSGAAYAEDKARGLGAGADRYVVKPDIDGLRDAVAELLALSDCAAPAGD
jgi:DNA-binding response OmpR family regulator